MLFLKKRPFLILSWSLYDLANQFFAVNVVSLYFVRWLTLERGAPEIFYSISFGISMLLVALSAPVLGMLSDATQKRKPFLIYLTILSVVFTVFLSVSKGIFSGLLFFAVANFGCQLAVVFYNALLVNIAPKGKIGLVSGIGRMSAYLGAILALYLIRPVILKSGYQSAFLPTGILFLLFSLPCLIFVKDKKSGVKTSLVSFLKKEKLSGIFSDVKTSFLGAWRIKGFANLLKAAFFSLCAVNAVVLFMSVYATRVFGLGESRVISLIAFSAVFAVLGSLFWGYLSDLLGYKRCLLIVLFLWSFSFLLGALATSASWYWFIGAMVGMALGATWVIWRALIIRLVPEEKVGAIFGIFNLLGYLSATAGAMFWGLALLILSPLGEWGYRLTLLSLILFMLAAFVFVLRIPQDEVYAKRRAGHS